jgi:23S rRNA pseudouridine2605 synthase
MARAESGGVRPASWFFYSAVRTLNSALPVVRLQKFLADAAIASRRAAEQFILDGRVAVNGAPVRLLGSKVDPEHDQVTVDGKPVRVQRKHYLVLHKPRGCVCSKKDEHDRPTVYDLLPKEWQTVNSVGRLDYASEGLLFLTNDGEFALHLTHPRYGVRKRYVATVEGKVDDEMLREFTTGVWQGGEKLKAERGWIISATKAASVVELELAEGKNREVRRLFESQGLTVKRLVRTMIGKIKLGELKVGRWRTLTQSEIKTLLS